MYDWSAAVREAETRLLIFETQGQGERARDAAANARRTVAKRIREIRKIEGLRENERLRYSLKTREPYKPIPRKEFLIRIEVGAQSEPKVWKLELDTRHFCIAQACAKSW